MLTADQIVAHLRTLHPEAISVETCMLNGRPVAIVFLPSNYWDPCIFAYDLSALGPFTEAADWVDPTYLAKPA